MRCRFSCFFFVLAISVAKFGFASSPDGPRFEIRFPSSTRANPITGRVFVIISRDNSREPRFQAGAHYMGCPFFAVDVEQLRPESAAIIDNNTPGYPVRSLRDMPSDDYYIQAFVNVYTQFHRADHHTIWAHMDQWEGQSMFTSPGNLFGEVQKIHLDPHGYVVKLQALKVVPPVVVPADTSWVKHIKIQSELLTRFWGQPIYLGAVVLLPRDYDRHADVFYPVDYEQDHFSLSPPYHFREDPPTAPPGTVLAMREAEGYQLFKDWSSENFPRLLMVTFLHPTPYFDDSYAVNSANNGPYGDAIMTELIPYIETHFRIIRRPYARVLSGGSTGGWESLALQLHYPEFFDGAWVYYPDPIDFRRWGLANIYEDENMFYAPRATATALGSTDWQKVRRPWIRLPDGQALVDFQEETLLEEVLGSKGRSGEQNDIWQAVYGPVDPDGYPMPLWDEQTGAINHTVARYMRDHGYDLRSYMEDNWSRLGPNIVGKLHFYVGDMDHYYLNLAVYLTEDFLKNTKDPYYAGSFDYGRPLKGHGKRPATAGDMIRQMADAITKNASAGEPTSSWKY
jgi:hypothetical protein